MRHVEHILFVDIVDCRFFIHEVDEEKLFGGFFFLCTTRGDQRSIRLIFKTKIWDLTFVRSGLIRLVLGRHLTDLVRYTGHFTAF